jgi:hypothetical protein
MRKMKCLPGKISKSLYSLYSKKITRRFFIKRLESIDLHFFCTDKRSEAKKKKQRKTPGEYKLLKLVNTTKKS